MPTVTASMGIHIRPSRPGDARRLVRLAQLDSSHVPAAPLLLAFEDGELRAAVSLASGEVIADPFFPSARLVELLAIDDRPTRRPNQYVRAAGGSRSTPRRWKKAPKEPARIATTDMA